MAFPPHPPDKQWKKNKTKTRNLILYCVKNSQFGLSSDSNSISDKVSESGQASPPPPVPKALGEIRCWL